MKITDAKNHFGSSVAGQASIDGNLRSAYRASNDVASALADGIETFAKNMYGLQRAEEDAKANELKSKYQIEYNEQVNNLKLTHQKDNLSAAEYEKRHQKILDDLHAKYSGAYNFQTEYGKRFQQFLDLDKENKRVGAMGDIQDIAIQNQQIAWAKGEQNRLNAAIGGDYQNLQNQIEEQKKVYFSPAYLVQHGDKAVSDAQAFIDSATSNWIDKAIATGSDPAALLDNIHDPKMYPGVSEETRTKIAISLAAKVKARAKEQERLRKKQQAALVIENARKNIELTGVVNPEDKTQVKAFEQQLAVIGKTAATPMEGLQAQMNLRIQTGFIEDKEIGRLGALFNSNNEQAAEMAVQQVRHYLNENPAMAKYFSKNKELMYVTNLVDSGVDIATAIDMNKRKLSLTKDEQKDLLKDARSEEILSSAQSTIAERVAEHFGGDSTLGFGGWDSENTDKVEERAAQIFPQMYLAYHGNAEAATKATIQQLTMSHGVTAIGGKERFMYRAPSTFIHSNEDIDREVIQKLFIDEMTAQGMDPEKAAKATIAYIGIDGKTKMPKYSVQYNYEPAKIGGRVVQWLFDPQAVVERKKAIEEKRLKKIRDENIKRIKAAQAEVKRQEEVRTKDPTERIKSNPAYYKNLSVFGSK